MFSFITRAAAAWRGVSGANLVPATTRAVPKRGTRETLAAYSSSPILQAVARKIAFGVASTEWKAATIVDGSEQIVDDHLLGRLLNSGVPGLDGLQCRLAIELQLLLVGDAFVVLDRNALGVPVRRWPTSPHWIRETPRPGHPYYDVQPEGGSLLRFASEDVVWFKDVDPMRPYERGSGVAMALDDELSADEYAAKHISNSLANRARPDIIVSGTETKPFDQKAVDRLSEVWGQRFGGPNRAGLPMFSFGPVKVESLTPNFKELELTGLRAYERDIIVSVFGVPPELVGILANSNRATIESAEFLFTKHVIRPRLLARKAVIDDQLAPQYDSALYSTYDDPVDEDAEARRAYMNQRPDAFTIDEHRAQAGHSPLPDGAGRRFPMAFTTVYGDHRPVEQASSRRSKRAPKAKNAIDDVDGIDDEWFVNSLEVAYRETIQDFAEQAFADVGVEIAFDVLEPRVVEFISEMAAERSKLIVGTTREALKSTLSEGVASGESSQRLVARIREAVGEMTDYRANMIARTEIVQASNYATTEAHKEAGIEQREWLATQDSRVRDTHSALDGQVVGIDEPFKVSGYSTPYPGGFGVASQDINCRCAVLPKLPESLTGAKRKAAWLKVEGGRAGHERALEAAIKRDFEALADDLASKVGG